MLTTFTLLAGVVLGAPPLNGEDRAQVEQGEVVVKRLTPTDDSGVSARAYGVVDAPPAEVFPVVRDCAYFHEFMPRTKNSKLVSQEGPVAICEVEISMPFPISNLVATTRSTNKELPGGGFERRWSLVEGDYNRNNGAWEVTPWGADGKKTLLVYWLDVDPKVMVPDAIIRRAQTGSLPDVFEAVRKRVSERRGR